MTPTLEHIWHEFAVKLGQFIRARVAAKLALPHRAQRHHRPLPHAQGND
jgi:hypothetical protein